jgi:hypothetical protein
VRFVSGDGEATLRGSFHVRPWSIINSCKQNAGKRLFSLICSFFGMNLSFVIRFSTLPPCSKPFEPGIKIAPRH